jgi:hypothetical protein
MALRVALTGSDAGLGGATLTHASDVPRNPLSPIDSSDTSLPGRGSDSEPATTRRKRGLGSWHDPIVRLCVPWGDASLPSLRTQDDFARYLPVLAT